MTFEDIQCIRASNLSKWFTDRQIPPNEKSYISQLINKKTSFGEKAARRLESEYGMPKGFLDCTSSTKVTSLALTSDEIELIEIYRKLPASSKARALNQFKQMDDLYAKLFKELMASRN